MSTQTEITRLQSARNTIRQKLVTLGLATNTDKLDACASAIEGIVNCGKVTASVVEGESYTIPKGYHDGSGTVAGVAGGGNYSLQAKTVTPTKSQQAISSDAGYYGLSSVTVAAIPDAYQDVSSVTATAGDVLANKVIVNADGEIIAGTMADNGAVIKTLDASSGNQTYTVPAGYHDGKGSVKIALETKTATPTKAAQDITPTAGKVLSKVTVNAIPDNYIDTTDADAVAANILIDKTAYVDGVKVTGTMADNGAVIKTLDASSGNQTYTVPAGYHDGKGSVEIALETKTATPTKSAQDITPTAGKVLSKVTVNAIPDNYIDTTDADAVAANILIDKTAYVDGVKVKGTMADNGAATATMDGLTTTSVTIPAGYTTGGTVSLTDAIETALAAI
jgi:hypothetical protein